MFIVSEILPDALSTGCSKCNEKQKHTANKVVNYLRTKRPKDWERLSAKYDSSGEYKKRYENVLQPTKNSWIYIYRSKQ